MYKLAGLDAGFLHTETPRAPQHVASIQLLELPEGVTAERHIADFKQVLLERAHLVPYFANKLQFVPFGLDHPVWVRDRNFNIDNHVLQAEVAAPGGRRELEAKVAELHALPLDRNRPLWEIWVLTGLEGGRIAYYNRVHHACLDGVSAQSAIEAVLDVTPVPRAVPPPPAAAADHLQPESLGSLLFGAFENLAKYQVRQATRFADHARTAHRLWQRSIDPSKGFGALTDPAPQTRWNRAIHLARSYAGGELPLADLKAIGKATGTTINDVFLAVCSGALRAYFGRLGELPARSLIAGCPVSLRRPGDVTCNNQVILMRVSFASDEPDPVRRLLKIASSSQQAKGFVADLADSYDTDVALPGLPGLLGAGMRMLEAGNLADWPIGPLLPCNVIVSNMPGPREQLYSVGAKVLAHHPVSIPAHSQGANITVQSYAGQMFFGITGCARALPDPALLRRDMLDAFAELRRRILESKVTFAPREPAPGPDAQPSREQDAAAVQSAAA